jgi:hypothetical protein
MGTPGTQAINQFLYPKMPYDTAKDLVPVSFVVRVPNVLMVNPQLPAKDIKQLIAMLKAQPGKLSYGTPGNGSTGHLSTELFKTQAGVFVTHIPYRGSRPPPCPGRRRSPACCPATSPNPGSCWWRRPARRSRSSTSCRPRSTAS